MLASQWLAAGAGFAFHYFNAKLSEERKARIERVNGQVWGRRPRPAAACSGGAAAGGGGTRTRVVSGCETRSRACLGAPPRAPLTRTRS